MKKNKAMAGLMKWSVVEIAEINSKQPDSLFVVLYLAKNGYFLSVLTPEEFKKCRFPSNYSARMQYQRHEVAVSQFIELIDLIANDYDNEAEMAEEKKTIGFWKSDDL